MPSGLAFLGCVEIFKLSPVITCTLKEIINQTDLYFLSLATFLFLCSNTGDAQETFPFFCPVQL